MSLFRSATDEKIISKLSECQVDIWSQTWQGCDIRLGQVLFIFRQVAFHQRDSLFSGLFIDSISYPHLLQKLFQALIVFYWLPFYAVC